MIIGPLIRDAVASPEHAQRIITMRNTLAQKMKAQDVPYLEIKELTESSYPENEKYFGELIHPNALGHRLMAEQLQRAIQTFL